jgi:four helix bundle protein
MGAKYENLKAWQIAHEITLVLFRETETWPKREWYGLAAHLRKTAVSIGSNLAEGTGKRTRADYRRYVDIALGSYNEAEYQYRLGRDLGYVGGERYEQLRPRFDELGRCLYGLAKSLDT